MLNSEDMLDCFDYVMNCQDAHRMLGHYVNKRGDHDCVVQAIIFAKADWRKNFRGKEDPPAWYSAPAVDAVWGVSLLALEHQDQFQ